VTNKDKISKFVKSRTARLAATYLAIIMAMSIIFSVVIFSLSSRQLDRPFEPRPMQVGISRIAFNDPSIQNLISDRANAGRAELVWSLVQLNLAILVGGAVFSYLLARKTLKPIEEAMDAQTQFVSDASHELRTPLTALQTINEVALRKKQLSQGEARQIIVQNVEEANKLHELTSGLLSLVRSDKVNHVSEPVSLQQVTSEAMESIIEKAQAKNIEVDDRTPNLKVVAHKLSLVQVTRILLDNAVKYSKNDSRVIIETKRSNGHVILKVIDRGIGISRDDQDKIFNRFYRVDSSRSKSESDGYGLGLAIAKNICDHQGIKLSVESKIDKGSTFSLYIRLAN